MQKRIPTPAYPEMMPVDISFVFEKEKPAGKHGFLKADGDVFRFEDGTEGLFWGVNFNGGANFPEHPYAEMVARRLAQAGCNIVRFHQLDAQWDSPNIFAFTKGKRVSTTREFDPVSMDRLDYLIHCLKEQGIYVYLDMMTYRKFKSGDDVPFADQLPDAAKPYSIFDRRLIELQKEFCTNIWNHKNPYTGLAYKDDPVIVMSEITNEEDLFNNPMTTKTVLVDYYARELRELVRDWAKKNDSPLDAENIELFGNAKDPELVRCYLDITRAYYREMRDHMRSIGVKIPITGNNRLHAHAGNITCLNEMDFCDNHHYYYQWNWGEEDKFATHAQINGYPTVAANLGCLRLNNRPFFVSEWDMPWPNAYRAEGPIYYAALSALQNWGGMAIHTYAYTPRTDRMNILGKEASSHTIGGVPYREGIFSTWNDPAKFGLFYHAALIVRRRDIKPLEKKIGLTLPDPAKVVCDALKTGVEIHRMATVMTKEDEAGCDEILSMADKIQREDPDLIAADNGQMWRSIKRKVGGIDTPMTKIIYGRLAVIKNGSTTPTEGTAVDGMRLEGYTDFGVVALSSLTEDPIEKSDNMLLSAIGRACNTGMVFDGDKLVDFGKAPILSEVIRAKITIRTQRTDLKVWGVNSEGCYVGEIPAAFENGEMTFTIGEKLPAIYYLIVAE